MPRRPSFPSGQGARGGRWIRIPLLLAVAFAAAACGPRYARVTVHDGDGLIVQLRAETQGDGAVDRGFTHPATISPARITNILSRIDVRLESKKESPREPAIHAELLFPLGDLVSTALAKADPSQEVVVKAVRKERRLGIFNEKYLTSFVSYVLGDDLYVHLSRVDYSVPKDGSDELPEPWPDREVMRFKVLPGEGIIPVAPQGVTAAWRDPLFRSGSHVRVGPGGKVMRRQILLEGPSEEIETTAPQITGDPSPETLRALADLEESRRQGVISEAEYQERRRRILASDPSAH